MAGNTNILIDRKPYVLEQAERYGVADIFDNYIQGADNKDVRDIYSELPIEYASQLAALEKKELDEGMIKKDIEQRLTGGGQGLAQGGLANLMKKYYD